MEVKIPNSSHKQDTNLHNETYIYSQVSRSCFSVFQRKLIFFTDKLKASHRFSFQFEEQFNIPYYLLSHRSNKKFLRQKKGTTDNFW